MRGVSLLVARLFMDSAVNRHRAFQVEAVKNVRYTTPPVDSLGFPQSPTMPVRVSLSLPWSEMSAAHGLLALLLRRLEF